MSDWDDEDADADVERAPICPACGVTALPAETSNVLDSGFICENRSASIKWCESFEYGQCSDT